MNKPLSLPDANGLFGSFGGRFVAETLMPLILELQDEYATAKNDPEFQRQLAYFQGDYVAAPARSTLPSGSPSTSAARVFTSSVKS